ncbi:ribosome-binding factor A [Dehalogenimonas formicexedens]|uniref:Ribosome-binding factor A n=1 Tax=Dehalogenimonas formicexedens TaxID=1839801 RepID=A0A1P8F7U9_9CHLR|nr:30S ribosome-binding factor RbfA [Dehalogenimonas formicexedens]APV44541.1 ribosome-binding factor A [Dehalogenimonas formicexedens]
MSHRIERVNQLIRKEISESLQREVNDPRLSGVISVTAVETAPDLKFAKVYVSHLAGAERRDEILSALNSAAGFFRGELGRVLTMRYVPEIHFYWDESIERGARLSQLIDQAKAADARLDNQ